jgi:signal transduction histidine kinase
VSLRAPLVSRFRNLRLFWKLLVPSLVVTLVLGLSGVFVLVRYLSSKAQSGLDQRLSRVSLDAQAQVRDQVLYLLESVRLAANLEGIPEAVGAGDAATAGRRVAGVASVRTALDLLVVTDREGRGLVEVRRQGDQLSSGRGSGWSDEPFVADVLRGMVDAEGDKRAGFLRVEGSDVLAVAAPVRARGVVAGAVVAGVIVARMTEQIAARVQAAVAVHGGDGRLLGGSGREAPTRSIPAVDPTGPVRRLERVGSQDVASLYATLDLRDLRGATLVVSLPRSPVLAGVRGAAVLLALVFLLVMVAVVGLGAVLSRLVLAQVRPLIATNRALGKGDLSARAPVLGDDELGELARGLNVMAEQLQASYRGLEDRVAERTKELAQLYEEISAKARARSDFFAALSHDFRTPLFVIMGHAELLLDPDPPEDPGWREEFGRTVLEAAQHLLRRVDELLELARLESGTVELELQPLRLGDVGGGLRRMIMALAEASDLRVEIRVAKDLPAVWADPARLHEILLNLVSNAIKYTPAGGRVRVSAAARPGSVGVSVSDTGVGIPVEAQSRIFEPFYRVKGTKAQRGQSSTGLGLAITKRLVEAHGGEIGLTSTPGAGSTFTFTLLAVDGRAAPAGGEREAVPPARRGLLARSSQ